MWSGWCELDVESMGGLIWEAKVHPRVRSMGFKMKREVRSLGSRLGALLGKLGALRGRLGALKWHILGGLVTLLLLSR